MHELLRVGALVAFEYPHANLKVVRRKRFEHRRLWIQRVRDLELEPLICNEQFEPDPDINRGKWLVYGVDLDKREERKFYFASMVNLKLIRPDSSVARSLLILYLRNGIVFDQTDVRDPRETICRSFNQDGGEIVAIPA